MPYPRTPAPRWSPTAEEALRLLREAGYEPLMDYPGVQEPWRSRCTTCKRIRRPRLSDIRAGVRCRHLRIDERPLRKPRIDPEQVAARMLELGWRPLTPFTTVTAPRLCECIKCGHRQSPAYTNAARRDTRCPHCYPVSGRGPGTSRKKKTTA